MHEDNFGTVCLCVTVCSAFPRLLGIESHAIDTGRYAAAMVAIWWAMIEQLLSSPTLVSVADVLAHLSQPETNILPTTVAALGIAALCMYTMYKSTVTQRQYVVVVVLLPTRFPTLVVVVVTTR